VYSELTEDKGMKKQNCDQLETKNNQDSIKPWLEMIGIVLVTTTSISFFALVILSYALGINILA
tara:strand:- start:260 stop:451 length:192 start_codon:yes stop_codon:yes gene_type:complete